MHDGIHKNAPVSKEWKPLIKSCNQGIWKDSAPRIAEKIITKMCKELVPIVEKAQSLLLNPQMSLNQSMVIEQLRCSCNTTLQDKFVDSLERHMAHNSLQPIEQACKSAIQGSLDANLRNIDGYLALHFPQERAETNNRLRQIIIISIDIEKPVKNLMAGIKSQPARLSPLTLDEVIV